MTPEEFRVWRKILGDPNPQKIFKYLSKFEKKERWIRLRLIANNLYSCDAREFVGKVLTEYRSGFEEMKAWFWDLTEKEYTELDKEFKKRQERGEADKILLEIYQEE